MKVVALKPLFYKAKIRETGTEFDIDDVSYYTWGERGWIKPVGEISETDVVTVDEGLEGLPALDEAPLRKRK